MNSRRRIRVPSAIPALLLAAASLGGETGQSLSQGNDGAFYFHGTIDQTLEIDMALKQHGKQIDGSYMYASQRKTILLKGETTVIGEYQLEEFGPDGSVSGHFKLNELAGAGHRTGTWESADGKRKLTVVLGEITSTQHQLLLRLWETKPQIVALSVGANHSCVMRTFGASCWGEFTLMPSLATRGPGMMTQRALPNLLIDETITAVATGSRRLSCAIKESKVYCWGNHNFLGDLGDKIPQALGDVVEVSGIENATQIRVGPGYSCALTSDLRVFCWGDNEFGQTGNTSHDVCKEPNGHADAIEIPCNRHPVEVRGLR